MFQRFLILVQLLSLSANNSSTKQPTEDQNFLRGDRGQFIFIALPKDTLKPNLTICHQQHIGHQAASTDEVLPLTLPFLIRNVMS